MRERLIWESLTCFNKIQEITQLDASSVDALQHTWCKVTLTLIDHTEHPGGKEQCTGGTRIGLKNQKSL